MKNNILQWLKQTSFNNDFFLKFKNQLQQNNKAAKILSKFMHSQQCSKEELDQIKTLVTDTLKLTGLSSLFILPGGSLLIWALLQGAKQHDINLLPSQFESLNQDKIWSGKHVWQWIVDVTPNKENIPYGFKKDIISRKFKIKQIDPKDLLDSDPDFKEYYLSGEDRYFNLDTNDDDWQDPSGLDNEAVIVDGTVLDGYNRLAWHIRNDSNLVSTYIAQ